MLECKLEKIPHCCEVDFLFDVWKVADCGGDFENIQNITLKKTPQSERCCLQYGTQCSEDCRDLCIRDQPAAVLEAATTNYSSAK